MVESLDDHEEVRSGCKIEIFWPDDQLWYPGTVGVTGADGKRKIEYDDGDIEFLELSKEKYRLPTAEALSRDAGGGAAAFYGRELRSPLEDLRGLLCGRRIALVAGN